MKIQKFLIALLLMLSQVTLPAQNYQELEAPLTFFIANDLGRNGYYKQKLFCIDL